MIAEDNQAVIEQKQKLLGQHRRNLSYLDRQATQYGFTVPLEIHNGLIAEQAAVAGLERDLAALGMSPRPKANGRPWLLTLTAIGATLLSAVSINWVAQPLRARLFPQ